MVRFRDDPRQRPRWLNASVNRIEKSFRPGQMREASGFRLSEYKQHCSWGGHPNPSARWLLPNHAGFPVEPSLLVVDLAQHLTETADVLRAILVTLPMVDLNALSPDDTLRDACQQCHAEDPWAGRITIPVSPGEV